MGYRCGQMTCGNPNLPQAWTERFWPPEQWLSEGLLNSFENIKFLIPNAEEHGPIHLTSPFLTTYIEHWNPVKDPQKQPYHYQTRQEAIDLIDFYDGLAIVGPSLGGLHAGHGVLPRAGSPSLDRCG